MPEHVVDTVVGRLRLDASQYHAELAKAGQAASGFASALQGVLLGAGMAGTAAIGSFVAQVTRSARELETLRKQTIALAGGIPEHVNKAFGSLPALARQTGVAATEAAKGLYFVASAGLRGAEASEIVAVAAKAAAVGLGDMADITRVLVSAINVWGKENLTAARAADVLLASVREGVIEPAEMAQSLGRLLPVAKQMGLDFAQTAGVVAAFTRKGLDAAEAVTAFRAVLVQLIQASPETRKALQDAGTSLEGLVRLLRSGDIVGFLKELDSAFRSNSDAVQRAFGDVRSLIGVLNLVGADGKTVEEVLRAVASSAGDLERAFKETEGPSRELKRAMAELEDAGSKIVKPLFEAIVPAVKALADSIGPAMGGLREFAAVAGAVFAGRALTGALEALKGMKATIEGLGTAATVSGASVSAFLGTLGSAATLATIVGLGLSAVFNSLNKIGPPLEMRAKQLREDVAEFKRTYDLIQKIGDKLAIQGVRDLPKIPAQITPEELAKLEKKFLDLWHASRQAGQETKKALDDVGGAVKRLEPSQLTQLEIAWKKLLFEIDQAKGVDPANFLERAKQISDQIMKLRERALSQAQRQEDVDSAAVELADAKLEREQLLARLQQASFAWQRQLWQLELQRAELTARMTGNTEALQSAYERIYGALIRQAEAQKDIVEAEKLRLELEEKLFQLEQGDVGPLRPTLEFQSLWKPPDQQALRELRLALAEAVAGAFLEALASKDVREAFAGLFGEIGRIGAFQLSKLGQAWAQTGSWQKALEASGFAAPGGGADWQKLGAAALQAVGGAIYQGAVRASNRGAAALGGLISGAVTGWQVTGGNIVGAVVGAIIGAIAGWFSAGGDKKIAVNLQLSRAIGRIFLDVTGPTEEEERQIAGQIADRFVQLALAIRKVFRDLRLALPDFRDFEISFRGELGDFNNWLSRFLAGELPKAMFEPISNLLRDALAALGVSGDRIAQEFEQLQRAGDFTQALERFRQWIGLLLEVKKEIAGIQDLETLRLRAGEGSIVTLQRDAAKALEELGQSLADFAQLTTEEQLQVGQEALQAARAQIQAIEQAIQAFEGLRRQIVSQFESFLEARQLQAAERAGGGLEFRLGKYRQALERLAQAADEKALQQAASDVLRWADSLAQAEDAIRGWLDALAELQESLEGLQKDVQSTLAGGRRTGLEGWREQLGEFSRELEKLSSGLANLAPNELLSRLQRIAQLQRERYQADLQMLEAIRAAQERVLASYQDALAAIEEAQAEDQGPQALANLLISRIREIYQQLQSATDPDQIAQLFQQLQQYAMRLLQMRGEIDLQSETGAPINLFDWLRQLLESAQSIAQAQLRQGEAEVRNELENLGDSLAQFGSDLTGFREAFLEQLQAVQDALAQLPEAIDGVNSAIDRWQADLDQQRQAFIGLLEDLLAGLSGLNAALEPWAGIGGGGGGGRGGGGGGGPEPPSPEPPPEIPIHELGRGAAQAAQALEELASRAQAMGGQVAITVRLDDNLVADVWGAVELVRLLRGAA